MYKFVHATLAEAYIWWCGIRSHLFGLGFVHLLLTNLLRTLPLSLLCCLSFLYNSCAEYIKSLEYCNECCAFFVMLAFRFCSLVRVAKWYCNRCLRHRLFRFQPKEARCSRWFMCSVLLYYITVFLICLSFITFALFYFDSVWCVRLLSAWLCVNLSLFKYNSR